MPYAASTGSARAPGCHLEHGRAQEQVVQLEVVQAPRRPGDELAGDHRQIRDTVNCAVCRPCWLASFSSLSACMPPDEQSMYRSMDSQSTVPRIHGDTRRQGRQRYEDRLDLGRDSAD